MKKIYTDLLLIGSILASIGGVAAFILLFARDFNIFILILAPVILACYQFPAVGLYWLYKKYRPQKPDKPANDQDLHV